MPKIIYLGGIGENKNYFLYSRIHSLFSLEYKIKPYFIFKSTNNFPDDFDTKIENIIKKNPAVELIIGHSLGAYASLYLHKICNKLILIETSINPKLIFNDKKIKIKKIQTLLKLNSKNKLFFIGAENAGKKVSTEYYKLSGNNSKLYVIKDCDHNLTKEKNFIDLVGIFKKEILN